MEENNNFLDKRRKDIIYKKFRTIHIKYLENLFKDFYAVSLNIERTKIMIKICEYIIENVEEIN